MSPAVAFTTPKVGRLAIIGLGASYVVFAIGRAVLLLLQGESIWAFWIDAGLVTSIGLGLIYGGYSIGRPEIGPEFYSVIASWCLGGFTAILVLVMLFEINPGTDVTNPERAIPLLTSMGSLAGFGVGIHRAKEAELEQTKTRLEEAIGHLEASNDRLDRFATAVSHDLKQPLRSMTLQLELLERGSSDALGEEEQEDLAEAIESAKRLREMVDGLLEFARIHAGETSFGEVNCEEVVEEVLADLDALVGEREANVIVEELPVVYGNREQLHQLFQNLLENAIKYTSEDRPEISVESEQTREGWELCVADRGIGISAEDADKIFGLFERSRQVEETEGIGLGLAMCAEIVDRHGGEIWVDSTPGEGSTFCFSLPKWGRRPESMRLEEKVGAFFETDWN